MIDEIPLELIDDVTTEADDPCADLIVHPSMMLTWILKSYGYSNDEILRVHEKNNLIVREWIRWSKRRQCYLLTARYPDIQMYCDALLDEGIDPEYYPYFRETWKWIHNPDDTVNHGIYVMMNDLIGWKREHGLPVNVKYGVSDDTGDEISYDEFIERKRHFYSEVNDAKFSREFNEPNDDGENYWENLKEIIHREVEEYMTEHRR